MILLGRQEQRRSSDAMQPFPDVVSPQRVEPIEIPAPGGLRRQLHEPRDLLALGVRGMHARRRRSADDLHRAPWQEAQAEDRQPQSPLRGEEWKRVEHDEPRHLLRHRQRQRHRQRPTERFTDHDSSALDRCGGIDDASEIGNEAIHVAGVVAQRESRDAIVSRQQGNLAIEEEAGPVHAGYENDSLSVAGD